LPIARAARRFAGEEIKATQFAGAFK